MIQFFHNHKRKLTFALLGTLLTMWLGSAIAACADGHHETMVAEDPCSCCPDSNAPPSKDHCEEPKTTCAPCFTVADTQTREAVLSSVEKRIDKNLFFSEPSGFTINAERIKLSIDRHYPVRLLNSLSLHPSLRYRILLI